MNNFRNLQERWGRKFCAGSFEAWQDRLDIKQLITKVSQPHTEAVSRSAYTGAISNQIQKSQVINVDFFL